ncbi:MAG: hypothetical protein ABI852_18470, partial [Gemmatimonadaceae bacterium]
GDRYNLAARRLMSRAIDATPLTQAFVDDLFKSYASNGKGGATVVVAQDGKVLINKAYGVPKQAHYMPETALPNVELRGLSQVLTASLAADARMDAAAIRRVTSVGGMQRVAYDSVARIWKGDVDDLYRFEQGRTALRPGAKDTSTVLRGFTTDTDNGLRRQSAFGIPDGHRSAWIRYPERRTTILILTNDDAADAKALSQRIAGKLFSK